MYKTFLALFTFLSFSFSISTHAQQIVTWETLAAVEYDYVHSETFKAYYTQLILSEYLEQLLGQEIEISGYVIPLDTQGDQYFLSANPFSACFFCGNAGQKSVMELRFSAQAHGKKYETDTYLSFKGTFLFRDEPFEVNYILDQAQIVDK